MISILIPTYKRPLFLKKAIESCLDELNYPIEILIGDDSPTSNIEIIKNIKIPSNYTIHYHHRKKALKQNKNVADLIDKAIGEYCMILHDDDYLLANSLSKLVSIAKYSTIKPLIVFGKQILINENGNLLSDNNLNSDYYRIKELEGLQEDATQMVINQQVPSNSFLFPLQIAKEIGYRDYLIVGDACDFDFALRMVIIGKCELYYLHDNISTYRLSDSSVSKTENNNAIYFKYKILDEFNIQSLNNGIYNKTLDRDLNVLCGYYINYKYKNELRKLYFSKNYPLKKKFTVRGFYHFLKLFI
jgi:glycosyltransferase involved in cell wall biosynthesis